MSENSLVSVIIPAYNHDKFIQATINSVIAQTYNNVELIVINDGSKDSTWQKIQDKKTVCEKRFIKTIFETQQNAGTCKTLNRLVSLAAGKYIYFFSSDDLMKPIALEKQVQVLENNQNIVLSVGDNEFIDGENKILERSAHGSFFPYGTSKNNSKTFAKFLMQTRPDVNFNSAVFGSYKSFLKGNYVPNGYLIRKAALDKIQKFTPEAPLEDYFMHLQLSKCGKYAFIPEVLFSYRIHGNNTVLDKEKMSKMFDKTLFHEVYLLKENVFPENYKKIFAETVLKFNIVKKFGCVEKRKNEFFSQTILSLFGKEFILRSSARKNIPDWFYKEQYKII